MNASLRIDIDLFISGHTFLLEAGDLIIVDLDEGIAFHKKTGCSFDITESEYYVEV